MKRTKKIISILFFLISPFLYTINFLENLQTTEKYKNEILEINNRADTAESEITYKDYFTSYVETDNQSQIMYYGRILKYYLANNFKISESDLETLNSSLTNSKGDLYNQLFIQNLFASTINISVYGASSDAEFFAESFSKWLNTPDELKNKSWEIINNFFIEILPKIIKIGGSNQSSIFQNGSPTKLENYIIDLISENIDSTTKYDGTLVTKSGGLDLKYYETDEIPFWGNYYLGYSLQTSSTDVYNQIRSQIYYEYGVQVDLKTQALQNILKIFSILLNDSYTKASSESIAQFEEFNSNHYETFEDLNENLSESTLDKTNVSGVDFLRTYKGMEQEYLGNPSNEKESFEWKEINTKELEDLTLFLYNMVFSIVLNEQWLENILSAFIVTPDYPMVSDSDDDMSGTMGVTYNGIYNNYLSTAYAYIILTGYSLLLDEFNSNYLVGFWSSPAKYSVLIHEFGHAVDGFGSRANSYRNTKYSQDQEYFTLYAGKYFVYKEKDSTTLIITLSTVGGVVLIGACAGFVTWRVLRRKKLK